MGELGRLRSLQTPEAPDLVESWRCYENKGEDPSEPRVVLHSKDGETGDLRGGPRSPSWLEFGLGSGT